MKGKILLAILISFFVCCKSKRAAESSTATVAGTRTELEVAGERWPGTTEAELSEGKNIFQTKCTRCHGEKKIVGRTEESWLHEIDKMSPKAKLTMEEKQKLTKYVLSYRTAHTAAKN